MSSSTSSEVVRSSPPIPPLHPNTRNFMLVPCPAEGISSPAPDRPVIKLASFPTPALTAAGKIAKFSAVIAENPGRPFPTALHIHDTIDL
jgi:hypothetical protein